MKRTDWKEQLTGFLYPARCPVCGEPSVPHLSLICPECEKKLPFIRGPRCMRCSKPVEEEEAEYCYDCRKRNFLCEKGFAVFRYDHLMSESIAGFKFRGRKEYARYYSMKMAEEAGTFLAANRAGLLIPVPLHKKRYAQRGYNQARLLAEGISERTGIPAADCLMRVRNTLPQKQLGDAGRSKNVGDAFKVSETIWKRLTEIPQTAVLIDDIYTTGSTIENCARVLLNAGVKRVLFLALCIGRGY